VKLFAVSGHVERPGIYEAPMGTTMRELLEWAGGVRQGHRLKFWVPGGSSVPLLTEEHLDVPYTYEDIAAAGSMLGTGTPMVFDETTSVTRAVTRWLEFYKHESCGKCTPCREGTYWLVDLLRRLEDGTGSAEDINKINEVSAQIAGRSFCALGDAAATPFPGAIKYFADEIALGTSTAASELFDPVSSTVFTGVSA
jgi:NADH-quinone oxidoreductase subunit F